MTDEMAKLIVTKPIGTPQSRRRQKKREAKAVKQQAGKRKKGKKIHSKHSR